MAADPVTPSQRPYRSPRRARQAAQTRADVLEAARALFAEHGWAAATLTAIAERAGVAVETIYNGFGSKKGLLLAAVDTAVVGDAEPIPLAARPEFKALAEGPLHDRLRRGVALVTDIHERTAGLWQTLVEAAASDDEVDRWRLEIEARRRIDLRRGLEAVLGQAVDDVLLTLVWVLFSSEAYRKLTRDAGLSRASYEELLVAAVGRLVPTAGRPAAPADAPRSATGATMGG